MAAQRESERKTTAHNDVLRQKDLEKQQKDLKIKELKDEI
jgi:hypothetical protein